MVAVETLVLCLSVMLLLSGVVITVAYRTASRRAVGSPGAEKQPIPAAQPTELVDPQVLRVLSERLSTLEGRLPVLQATVDGYGAIAMRLAELEARMPTISDAYDRFGQMVLNADKRAADRDKRQRNKTLTVEEAAAQGGMGALATAVVPSVPPKRSGVLGGNGQRSTKS